MTTFHDYLTEALDRILDWNLPDENLSGDTFGDMIRNEACIMARNYLD